MSIDALAFSESPKIRLGGCEWSVPELAVKQIMRLVPTLGRLEKLGRDGLEASAPPSEEEIKWIYDVAYIALTRAYPELTRERYDELPIKIGEIVEALPIIARQAGLERQAPGES